MPEEAVPRLLMVADSRRGHVTWRARGTIYREFFERDGWVVTFVDLARSSERAIAKLAARQDVVYLLKVASLSLVNRIRESGSARVAFDFCEPLWRPARRQSGWHDLDYILESADAVFAENETVGAYARLKNTRVFSVPDSAQVELFDAARREASVQSGVESSIQSSAQSGARSDEHPRQHGRLRIGWVGSRRTVPALEKIRESLRRLCARYPDLELRILGARPEDAARILGGMPHTVLTRYGEPEMVREMLAMDIGLYPAPFGDEDYAARGALKAKLYMAAGLPIVCHPGGDCSRILEDGVTGMLAGSPEEWEAKLETLIRDTALRERMGAAALDEARQHHTLEQAYRPCVPRARSCFTCHPVPSRRVVAGLRGSWRAGVVALRKSSHEARDYRCAGAYRLPAAAGAAPRRLVRSLAGGQPCDAACQFSVRSPRGRAVPVHGGGCARVRSACGF